MATSKGISVSFNNTPQAADDFFSAAQTGLTEDNAAVALLDVMGNDLGGNAKSLYSLDDGINSAGATGDLLQRDAVGSANRSLHGATIKITADGKVSYDASTLDASFAADLQHLSSGQYATDSFTYAIQLGNGTLSWATATVQIAGVNDAPVIVSPAANVQIAELANTFASAASDKASGAIGFTDLDFSDTHTAGFVANGNGYLGTFSLDPIAQDSTNGATGSVGWHFSVADGALDFLADAQQLTQSYTVTVDDGHNGTAQQVVTITLTGSNDAPVITSSTQAVAVNELSHTFGSTAPDAAGGTITFTDPDLKDIHNVSVLPDGSGYLGSLVLDPLTLDSTNGATGSVGWHFSVADHALDFLADGQQITQTYTVTVDDGHSGTAQETIAVTLTGSNDAPVLQAPVASTPVLANDSLTAVDTLAFSDADLKDTHAVTFTPQGSGYVGDFAPLITADANGHGTITTTYHLTKAQVQAAGGQFPAHQDYLVTIDDHHGGTSSQLVSIPLAQILSNGGGGSGTTVAPPVFINTNLFVSGHDLGQITDNPFLLENNGGPGPFSTNLFTQGTLQFSDPDGGFHTAFVDLAHAHISHFKMDSNGVVQSVPGTPEVGLLDGTWQVNVQEPGQVHWSYTLPESVIRPMTQGEWESVFVPITVSENGVGQSTETVRLDLFGTTEVPSLLPPNTLLTANMDISSYLLPPDQATHVQTQNFSISENPLVTGSPAHHTLSGSISYVDPDLLDRPAVSMQLDDPGVPLSPQVQALQNGFSYTLEQFGNYGMIHWTYDVQDSALDYLPQGSTQNVAATFHVSELSGSSMSTVNVALHGADDAPVIQGPTTTFADVALHHSASGSFVVTDPDWFPDGLNVQFVPQDPNTHGFIFGGLPVGSGQGSNDPLTWNYTADFGPGTLLSGQHDIWNVVVQDNSGLTATHTLDFHLV